MPSACISWQLSRQLHFQGVSCTLTLLVLHLLVRVAGAVPGPAGRPGVGWARQRGAHGECSGLGCGDAAARERSEPLTQGGPRVCRPHQPQPPRPAAHRPAGSASIHGGPWCSSSCSRCSSSEYTGTCTRGARNRPAGLHPEPPDGPGQPAGSSSEPEPWGRGRPLEWEQYAAVAEHRAARDGPGGQCWHEPVLGHAGDASLICCSIPRPAVPAIKAETGGLATPLSA